MTQQEIDNLQIGDVIRYQYNPEFETSFLTVTAVNMDETPHGMKSLRGKCTHFIDPKYTFLDKSSWQDNLTMLKDSFQLFKYSKNVVVKRKRCYERNKKHLRT